MQAPRHFVSGELCSCALMGKGILLLQGFLKKAIDQARFCNRVRINICRSSAIVRFSQSTAQSKARSQRCESFLVH